MIQKKILIILFGIMFLFISCSDNQDPNDISETSSNPVINNKKIVLSIIANKTKLRRGPGTKYDVITELTLGTKVILIDEREVKDNNITQKWYLVQVRDKNNLEGWVYSILAKREI